ncbi:group 3 secretory phospholipase A2 [Pelmatolapia mariae]|uniref:group 3 secretory phospholipase A2 n=1 Tax=Pelmatolapia mariae TaxID=158779 RepID=UPI002FE51033
MMRIAPLVTLICTSSLLSCTAAAASVLCTWTKVSANGEMHYSFIRSDPQQTPPSLRLYHTAWSGERALLGCTWSDDTAVTQNYLSLCRERARGFSEHPNENVHLDSVLETEGQCVSLASLGEPTGKRSVRSVRVQGQDQRSEVSIHKRVKRGFIVPGTLWCGSGNKAPSYSDLGVFSETDRCCREHDQCKHTILSFHSEFGIFNSNIFTMSHCDCDNKFRSCLVEANDGIADVVGYTFFNLLKMHCFTFSHRLQCTQRNWFGMCKETKMALYAEVHSPILYESKPTDESMNSSVINSTTPAELLENSTSDLQLSSNTAAAFTVPTPFASIIPLTNATTYTGSNATETPLGSVPDRRENLENIVPTKNHTVTEVGPDITAMSCGIYKDIDECRDKIPSQHEKYGFYNQEPKTLYHCNCTVRIFQTLAKQRQLTKVQAHLLGHVSQSCFLLEECTADSNCTLVVVKAELPQQDQWTNVAVEEQHHLQAVQLNLRRPNPRRAKRKDREVRLHKLCLRLTRRRQMKKKRKNV